MKGINLHLIGTDMVLLSTLKPHQQGRNSGKKPAQQKHLTIKTACEAQIFTLALAVTLAHPSIELDGKTVYSDTLFIWQHVLS